MGRRNVRASGRGRPQAQRNPWAGLPAPLHRSVEKMPVLPISGRCPGPKSRLRYATEAVALKALEQVRRDRIRKGHPEASIEKRAYACEITGCGGWHLTSRVSFERRPR
jgi:hypothetical protein